MRTTLHLDDEVYQAARSLATAEGTTIGRVISRLVRLALRPQPIRHRGGFPTFDVPPDAAPLTPDIVRRALEEE